MSELARENLEKVVWPERSSTETPGVPASICLLTKQEKDDCKPVGTLVDPQGNMSWPLKMKKLYQSLGEPAWCICLDQILPMHAVSILAASRHCNWMATKQVLWYLKGIDCQQCMELPSQSSSQENACTLEEDFCGSFRGMQLFLIWFITD
jgi:hypothetical protein